MGNQPIELVRVFNNSVGELHALMVSFEDTAFGIRATDRTIYWMDNGWDKLPEWRERNLIDEKWYPNSMHHTDQIWVGPMPDLTDHA